jgi:sugar (pentulose or hexulose) kinase
MHSVPAPLRGAVLTVAGHDHQTAAFAAGAAVPGVLFDSLGTAEALLRHLSAPPDTAALRAQIDALAAQGVSVGRAVVPDHLCVLAGILTGLTLERVCALLGALSREARYALGAEALAVPTGPDGQPLTTVRVLPSSGAALSGGDGLRIEGVTEESTPAALFAAALARVTADCDALLHATEAFAGPRESVVATGGWLNNPAVAAAKRHQHGEFSPSDLAEAGATGAAVMAGIAAGVLRRPRPVSSRAGPTAHRSPVGTTPALTSWSAHDQARRAARNVAGSKADRRLVRTAGHSRRRPTRHAASDALGGGPAHHRRRPARLQGRRGRRPVAAGHRRAARP